jgi:hypothetical protein
MSANLFGRWIAACLLVCLPGAAAGAAETALTGGVYLYAAGRQQPIPLSGYEVRLYDREKKIWLNPSITDAYGRYAFFGIAAKKYVLSVGKAGPHWRQNVWEQDVKAPGAVKPIVLSAAADIIPRASYQERSGEKNSYDFSLWLDVPEDQRQKIKSVTYVLNHPTFAQKEYASSKSEDGFRVGYRGWGCLNTVLIRIERQGAGSQITFRMCDELMGRTSGK